MERPRCDTCPKNSELETSVFPLKHSPEAFDDGSIVIVTESDLVGYDATHDSGHVGNDSLAELTLACRVQVASQAAITRISCLWLRCHHQKKLLGSSVGPDQVGCVTVDISVYWGVSSRYFPRKSFPIFLGYYSNFKWVGNFLDASCAFNFSRKQNVLWLQNAGSEFVHSFVM